MVAQIGRKLDKESSTKSVGFKKESLSLLVYYCYFSEKGILHGIMDGELKYSKEPINF